MKLYKIIDDEKLTVINFDYVKFVKIDLESQIAEIKIANSFEGFRFG